MINKKNPKTKHTRWNLRYYCWAYQSSLEKIKCNFQLNFYWSSCILNSKIQLDVFYFLTIHGSWPLWFQKKFPKNLRQETLKYFVVVLAHPLYSQLVFGMTSLYTCGNHKQLVVEGIDHPCQYVIVYVLSWNPTLHDTWSI